MSKQHREHTMGSGGECVCPRCNTTVAHQRGVPCQDTLCPDCGVKMLRVGSRHHELWLQKRAG
jgi:hypothetical protein